MDTWAQFITTDAMRAFRRLSDDNLRTANATLEVLQVDPYVGSTEGPRDPYKYSLGTVMVTYEILDDQQAIRVLKVEVAG